ncbi:MAG: AIPR family protein [Bacteroidia bacterium]
MVETNENLELNKFYNNLRQDVLAAVNVEEDGGIQEEKFTEIVISYLEEAGETENARECRDIKEDKIGRKVHKVNGYALSENYENLDLFITIFKGTDTPEKIYKDEITAAVNQCTKFLKNGLNHYFEEIEETSPIFDLAKTLGEIEKELVRVNIYIVSDGIAIFDSPKDSNLRDVLITYQIRDIEYLHRLNSSKTKRIPIEINFSENFGSPVPCISMPSHNSEYESYLAVISGETLAAIYQNYGSRLLEQNVRSFLQFTGKINKGIRETIMKEPHMFLAFNNGIAATAESVELVDLPDGGKAIKQVKDLQIVNGGQTTASIFHTKRKDKIDVSKIFVQMKLSVIKDVERISEIVSRISRYANTQNKVSEADLTSNNPLHIELEKLSRTIWANPKSGQSNQTRWFYERARGQYKDAINREGHSPAKRRAFEMKNPKSQMFTKEDLGKFYLSCNMQPWYVVRGRQKNYVEFMKLIKNQKPDNIFYEDIIAKAILFQTAEKIYGVTPNSIGDMRYITVPYAIAYVSHKTEGKIDLYKIWKNQNISEELRIILRTIMERMDSFIKGNAPGALYGEWAKNSLCWEKVKETDLGVDFLSIKGDFADPQSQERRYKRTDAEIAELERQAKVDELLSVPALMWKEIAKWGTISGKLSQYQRDVADKISTIVKKNDAFTNIQLEQGIQILTLVVEIAPELLFKADEFEQIEIAGKELAKNKKNQIDLELVNKLYVWDKKNKKLNNKEFYFLRKISESNKQPSDFQKQYLLFILEKARKNGLISE